MTKVTRNVGATAVLLAVVVTASACSGDGDPVGSLADRSVAPAAFPVHPSAVTRVPPAQLPAIVGDISGNPVGAEFDPADCAPQPISPTPARTVVQTAFGSATTPDGLPPAYTTVITRMGDSLDDLGELVRRCGDYRRGEVRIVQRILDGVPSVSGAKTLGYTRTETAAAGDPVTTVLLVAQRRKIRVYATERITGKAATGDRPTAELVKLLQAVAAEGLR
ncbi:MAG: hypothetical protein QM728_08170 [Gordonia sp. (in: high G+C Gram-positive bacteria)]|uniref:hypothetical protein n=1 Tax=Gordonia sp. (in: high G+C Gram-positive bacteria) TaxID=84139 RepID=UPI0039E476F6